MILKNIFTYILGLLLLFTGCAKQEVDLLFNETPAERMGKLQAEVLAQLTEAPNGWKVYNQTLSRGNYGYFMQFDANNRVKMIADINTNSAANMKESAYRIRMVNGPMLGFETHNYIHLLNDPNPGTMGGVRGDGLKSDIEFDLVKKTADSIVFKGRRYATDLVLTPATAAEKASYEKGDYLVQIEKTKAFFKSNPVAYAEINNVKYQFFINMNGKVLDAASLQNGKPVFSKVSLFFFTLKGMEMPDTLKVGPANLRNFSFEGEKIFAQTKEGEKFEIKSSTSAIVPLTDLIGLKFPSIRSPYLTYFPGTSAAGLTILKRYHENLANRATGYTFNHGYLDLKWDLVNKRITLTGFASQNGGTSGWATTIVYDYTFDAATKQYTLKKRTAATGGYTAVIMDQMDAFLLSGPISLDYYFESGNAYGKIKGVSKPEVEMTFQLQ